MRLKPRLLNLAAAVSLLLAVAIIVLWVRSAARHEAIARFWHTSTERRYWSVQSFYSSLSFTFAREPATGRTFPPRYQYDDFTRLGSKYPWRRPWFAFPPARFQHFPIPGSSLDIRELTVAYWLLLPPTLVLPAIAIVRHRRRRRRERGNLCPTCGYDLRAHSAGDRCPECGAANPRAV